MGSMNDTTGLSQYKADICKQFTLKVHWSLCSCVVWLTDLTVHVYVCRAVMPFSYRIPNFWMFYYFSSINHHIPLSSGDSLQARTIFYYLFPSWIYNLTWISFSKKNGNKYVKTASKSALRQYLAYFTTFYASHVTEENIYVQTQLSDRSSSLALPWHWRHIVMSW